MRPHERVDGLLRGVRVLSQRFAHPVAAERSKPDAAVGRWLRKQIRASGFGNLPVPIPLPIEFAYALVEKSVHGSFGLDGCVLRGLC